MQKQSANEITQLLRDWSQGDQSALEQLMPVVYQELHKIAGAYLRGERSEHTLQPTALIHEAYLRLINQNFPEWQSRVAAFNADGSLLAKSAWRNFSLTE